MAVKANPAMPIKTATIKLPTIELRMDRTSVDMFFWDSSRASNLPLILIFELLRSSNSLSRLDSFLSFRSHDSDTLLIAYLNSLNASRA